MDYRGIAMSELRDYLNKVAAIESLSDQIEMLGSRIYGIRSATSDGTPVQGGGNRREEQLLNNIAMRDQLAENLRIVKRQVRGMERGLNGLTERQRRIVDLLCIRYQHGNIQVLCDELNESEREVYRDRGDALRQYTISRYGVIDI